MKIKIYSLHFLLLSLSTNLLYSHLLQLDVWWIHGNYLWFIYSSPSHLLGLDASVYARIAPWALFSICLVYRARVTMVCLVEVDKKFTRDTLTPALNTEYKSPLVLSWSAPIHPHFIWHRVHGVRSHVALSPHLAFLSFNLRLRLKGAHALELSLKFKENVTHTVEVNPCWKWNVWMLEFLVWPCCARGSFYSTFSPTCSLSARHPLGCMLSACSVRDIKGSKLIVNIFFSIHFASSKFCHSSSFASLFTNKYLKHESELFTVERNDRDWKLEECKRV